MIVKKDMKKYWDTEFDLKSKSLKALMSKRFSTINIINLTRRLNSFQGVKLLFYGNGILNTKPNIYFWLRCGLANAFNDY